LSELGNVYRALMAATDEHKVLADEDIVAAVSSAVRASRPASVS